MRSPASAFLFAVLGVLGVGCSATSSEDAKDDDVIVDTRSRAARMQYDANVDFATAYKARCAPPDNEAARPRVLVTGFGRFMKIADNATGRIVSALVPDAKYPLTVAPPAGEIDPPEPQLSVARTTLDLPGIGDVDVCAMILPVHWDLATILVAKEIDSFRPTFVLMNGVAGPRQPLWLELGSTNRASAKVDGSNVLAPAVLEGEKLVPILDESKDDLQPNLASWDALRDAASRAIREHAREKDGGARFDEIVHGAVFAGYPRESNTYLCNHMTYVTGWLMNHPKTQVRLLRASTSVSGKQNDVPVTMQHDARNVPRLFVHWPSELANRHHAASADVMRAIIAAQLRSDGAQPTHGDNAFADPSVSPGEFF